jgi:hypothetical protein
LFRKLQRILILSTDADNDLADAELIPLYKPKQVSSQSLVTIPTAMHCVRSRHTQAEPTTAATWYGGHNETDILPRYRNAYMVVLQWHRPCNEFTYSRTKATRQVAEIYWASPFQCDFRPIHT